MNHIKHFEFVVFCVFYFLLALEDSLNFIFMLDCLFNNLLNYFFFFFYSFSSCKEIGYLFISLVFQIPGNLFPGDSHVHLKFTTIDEGNNGLVMLISFYL